MMYELKPCPFCGGSARVAQTTKAAWVIVVCCYCDATGPAGNISEAVAMWNKRPVERASSTYINVLERVVSKDCGPVLPYSDLSKALTEYMALVPGHKSGVRGEMMATELTEQACIDAGLPVINWNRGAVREYYLPVSKDCEVRVAVSFGVKRCYYDGLVYLVEFCGSTHPFYDVKTLEDFYLLRKLKGEATK